jgi:predicted RNase H-like nuclease (RuvC/YqgF family)
MTVRAKADLKIVDADHQQAEAALIEAVKQTSPMVQRLSTHRDRIDLAVKELESERFELISRRDSLRRQAEAVEQGFSMHIDDIEATIKLYEGGFNTVALQN